MAFTMHSHSGQFCPGHAKDQLEDVVKHAIEMGYKTMGLTEHMPRTKLEDLYPEEMDDPEASLSSLFPRHEAYLTEARRLQTKYSTQIHILIGFEAEWIRPDYENTVKSLATDPCIDYFIGSLHHTRGIPIDLDRLTYDDAVAAALAAQPVCVQKVSALVNGEAKDAGEEALYAAYYDEQYGMLQALRPKVVGHFDLIRLLSVRPGRDVRVEWPEVWAKIRRNLECVVGYGGWLECNSSALRKGLEEPYPGRIIAEEFLALGGRFTFSDDSHGIAQLGTNFERALSYLDSLDVKEVWTLERHPHPGVEGGVRAKLREKAASLEEFRMFFKRLPN